MIRVEETSFESAEESLEFEQNLMHGDPERPEILHLWECPRYSVVLGRSNKAEKAIDLAACRQDDVPVVTRSTGGGAVLVGPGCLNYGLVLSLDTRPELHGVQTSFRVLLGSLAASLHLILRGSSDLTLGEQKVSGNAQRRTRHRLLQHGTLMYAFDVAKIGRYLQEPVRQPHYRQHRSHAEFLANIPLPLPALKRRVIETWINL